MTAQDKNSRIIFRRAGQVVWSSAAPRSSSSSGAKDLTASPESRRDESDGKIKCESDAADLDTADSERELKKMQHSETPHTEPQSTAPEEKGDVTHMMTQVSQQTALLHISEAADATASAGIECLDTRSDTHPEPQSPGSQSTNTASSAATTVEEPRAGQRITKRVFPSTLAWRVYFDEEVFHESRVSENNKLNSKGIEGTFYLRMHETWRCRMCTYQGIQVWFDRKMNICPVCDTSKLQYIDAAENVFRAQGFREAEDGAVEFDDECSEKRMLDFVWEDFWDEMMRDDENAE